MSNIGVRFTRPDGSTFEQEMLSKPDARKFIRKQLVRHPEIREGAVVTRGNGRADCTDVAEPWMPA